MPKTQLGVPEDDGSNYRTETGDEDRECDQIVLWRGRGRVCTTPRLRHREHPANPTAVRRSWPRSSSTCLLDDLVRSLEKCLRNRQPEGGVEWLPAQGGLLMRRGV